MNAKPTFRQTFSPIIVVSALATAIAIGHLTAVAVLFQRDGKPLAHLAAAERACAQHLYVSERESCMREWLAANHASNVASK